MPVFFFFFSVGRAPLLPMHVAMTARLFSDSGLDEEMLVRLGLNSREQDATRSYTQKGVLSQRRAIS